MVRSLHPAASTQRRSPPKRIAVIGSGAAGLAASWALSRDHEVHLFEADDRLGGHAHTVDLELDGAAVAVDTGFIVYNEHNYPCLTDAFERLGVRTEASDMSFSVSTGDGGFEYSGRWPGGVLSQKRNLLSPVYWAMLRDIGGFYGRAADDLAAIADEDLTLDDYIARCGFSAAFRDRHLLPMIAAIWSLPTAKAGDMPAAPVIRFFQAHGLLRIKNRPQWRTVSGGSRNYVARIIADSRATVSTGCPVTEIRRGRDAVEIAVDGRGVRHFDHVVLATHADQALRLLSDPTPAEARALAAFKYSANQVVLHGDPSLMPKRRSAWAAWNFIEIGDGHQGVTYWMNLLQNLETVGPLLVTLNPPREPDPAQVYGTFDYDHPILGREAIAAQPALDSIQGQCRTWFCGSYFGYGFHEDAFASGLAVADRLEAAEGAALEAGAGEGGHRAHG
ncbi:MAG: FAD-dependent oxidoreductase [Alphaproteobacteria bacterium]|nr:FAD-dependent oxidoreductase [Alphaproteobacteria bacterium]